MVTELLENAQWRWQLLCSKNLSSWPEKDMALDYSYVPNICAGRIFFSIIRLKISFWRPFFIYVDEKKSKIDKICCKFFRQVRVSIQNKFLWLSDPSNLIRAYFCPPHLVCDSSLHPTCLNTSKKLLELIKIEVLTWVMGIR